MKIGLTYDLRSEYLAAGYTAEETAEFDREDTVSSLEAALAALGHTPERIGNARALVGRLARGDRWDLVFNIAEGLRGIGREAQVPALLDLYDVPYTFSDPLVMALTLHKGLTKRVVRDAGVPTAAFQVVTGAVAPPPFDPPYFIKPVAEGTGKGVSPASIIRRREELAGACRAMQARFRQPVLVEAFLPGREFTVGIVGTDSRAEAIGTIEVHLRPSAEAEVYSYVNKERYKELVEYRLVHPEEDPVVAEGVRVALEAWRVLGCRDGGRVDIRCDGAGRPQFMEVNPLAGLHPEHSDLPIIATRVGLSFQDLVARILDAALERVPPAGGRAPGEL